MGRVFHLPISSVEVQEGIVGGRHLNDNILLRPGDGHLGRATVQTALTRGGDCTPAPNRHLGSTKAHDATAYTQVHQSEMSAG